MIKLTYASDGTIVYFNPKWIRAIFEYENEKYIQFASNDRWSVKESMEEIIALIEEHNAKLANKTV